MPTTIVPRVIHIYSFQFSPLDRVPRILVIYRGFARGHVGYNPEMRSRAHSSVLRPNILIQSESLQNESGENMSCL